MKLLGILPEGQEIVDDVSPDINLILDVAPFPLFKLFVVPIPTHVACLPLPEVSYRILLLKLPAK